MVPVRDGIDWVLPVHEFMEAVQCAIYKLYATFQAFNKPSRAIFSFKDPDGDLL